MSNVSPESIVKQLQWRYAVKKFDPAKKIPADVWSQLEETLVLTPSSFGMQPWKFIVVTNPTVKEKLMAASWNQAQLKDCCHVVVFAIRKNMKEADVDRYLNHMITVRGGSIETLAGLKKAILSMLQLPPEKFNVNEWATRQVYIALGQFMMAAAVIGIDTCPMEGIVPAKYDEILNLDTEGFATTVVATAGYRAADDKYAAMPKVRFPHTELIEHID